MNRTSPGTRLDSIAARSPARSRAGPLVSRIAAPSSTATIMARLVLPSPGGPDSRMWSGGSPRRRDASSTSSSCSRTRGWPTNSASRRGRSVASTSRSSGCAAASVTGSVTGCARGGSARRAAPPTRSGAAVLGEHGVHRLLSGLGREAEAEQGLDDLVARAARRGAARSGPGAGATTLSRSSSTIRSAPLRPIPGTRVSAVASPSARARRSASGSSTASVARASRGPTPLTVCSSVNSSRSSASANPKSVSESSRTTSDVASRACSPRRSRASVAGWRAPPGPPHRPRRRRGPARSRAPHPGRPRSRRPLLTAHVARPSGLRAGSDPSAARHAVRCRGPIRPAPRTAPRRRCRLRGRRGEPGAVAAGDLGRPLPGLRHAVQHRSAPAVADRQGERVGGVGRAGAPRRARADASPWP